MLIYVLQVTHAKMHVLHIQKTVVFHAGDCRLLSDQIFNILELSEFVKVRGMQMF